MLGNILVEGLEIKITQFPNGFCLNYLLHSISHGHILVLTHCSLQFRKYEIKYKSSPRKNSLQVYILILINFLIQGSISDLPSTQTNYKAHFFDRIKSYPVVTLIISLKQARRAIFH